MDGVGSETAGVKCIVTSVTYSLICLLVLNQQDLQGKKETEENAIQLVIDSVV